MLAEIAARIKSKYPEYNQELSVIVADANDDVTLNAMCSQAKVLLNCVGPYRFFGQPVVQAAVNSRCNYVDITGEPEFMERCELKFDDAAKSMGVVSRNSLFHRFVKPRTCRWSFLLADLTASLQMLAPCTCSSCLLQKDNSVAGNVLTCRCGSSLLPSIQR